MPNQSQPRSDPRGIQFIDITDFTPGIYSYSTSTAFVQGGQPTGGTETQPYNSYPAPLGSSTEANTWGCLPQPSGGLMPGPGYTGSVTSAPPSGWTGRRYLSSFYVKSTDIGGAPEFVYMVEGLNTGSGHWTQLLVSSIAGTVSSISGAEVAYSSLSTAQTPAGALSVYTRMGTDVAGLWPVVVVPFPAPLGAANPSNYVMAYPDPTNNTTYADMQALNINSSVGNFEPSSLIAAYEGRVLIFTVEKLTVAAGSGETWDNDPVSFTDPVGNTVIGLQNTLFVPENPTGYTCTGTISAGELFVVKRRDAGGVITGDMNNPAITYLPGVQPGGGIPITATNEFTYGPVGQGASSTQGYYYCSSDLGAWRWNGGNTTTKVSTQLRDDFYYDASFGFASLSFTVQKWGQYILFSNSWIYDEITGGWWRLREQSPATPTYFWYAVGAESSLLYAAPTSTQSAISDPTWTYSTNLLCDTYSRANPNYLYSWQSQPIPLTEDKQVDIQEVNIRAVAPANSYTDCSITVYLTNELGVTTEFGICNNFTGNDLPQIFRLTGRFRCQSVQITVVSENTYTIDPSDISIPTPAPSIYSISIGYKPREKVGVTI